MKLRTIIITVLIIGFIISAFYNYKNIQEHFFPNQEEFFNNAVSNSGKEFYTGIVTDKYYDKYNHGRNIIVIENNGKESKIDYVYQKQALYDFININDTLTKEINTNYLRIKRKSLDTIILLKFENIKGSEKQNSKPEIIKTDDIPQGKMTYELYFAEFGERMKNLSVEILITGNKITVYNNEKNPLTGGKIIIEGILLKHKSGKWIIGKTETDRNAEEIGGCSGGPTPIDFKTKIIEWC